MTCECKCHTDGMSFCVNCEKGHDQKKSPGYLIDQTLQAFFFDRLEGSDDIKKLILIFDKSDLEITIVKDSFKLSVMTR